MKKLAVIKTGGKQYLVSQGKLLEIEKIPGKIGEKVTFDKVLLLAEDDKVSVGKPNVSGSFIEGEITKQFKAEKIKIAKFRAKSRYRRLGGHRQNKTMVIIKKISSKPSATKLASN